MKNKKPSFLTYDLIRQNKFRSPEKIQTVEKILTDNNCVINWWCRQSGKSLTSLKIARDHMLKSPIKVIFVSHNSGAAGDMKTKMARCIDRDLVLSESSKSMTLKNGSVAWFTAAGSAVAGDHIKDASLVCLDEFDFFSTSDIANWLREINNVIAPSMWLRFKNMFSFKKKTDLQAIFSSSMKDKNNLKLVRAVFPNAPITYMNYEKINYGPGRIDEMKKILSEKEFNTEYNSYFPQ